MSTSERLIYQISVQTEILKLKFLRDTGLDMILADVDVTDFTETDKTEMITVINDRIVELGGTV